MKKISKNKIILTGLLLLHDRMIVDFEKFPDQREHISTLAPVVAKLTRKYQRKCKRYKKWYGKNS